MPAESNSAIFTTWTSDLDVQNACVVCLCGELDVSTVPQFLNEMRPVMNRHRHIIMDVHLLEYADSTAVAAILSTAKVVGQTGHRFCLSGSHGVVARTLDAILAASEMARFDDVSSALESISQG